MPLQQNDQVQHHMLRLADMHLVFQSVEFPTLSLLFMTSLLLRMELSLIFRMVGHRWCIEIQVLFVR